MKPRLRNSDELLRRLEREARAGYAAYVAGTQHDEHAWWRWMKELHRRGQPPPPAVVERGAWVARPGVALDVHAASPSVGGAVFVGVPTEEAFFELRRKPGEPWRWHWTWPISPPHLTPVLTPDQSLRRFVESRVRDGLADLSWGLTPHPIDRDVIGPQPNPDDRLRRLEREARGGDPAARRRWFAEQLRAAGGVERDQLVLDSRGAVMGADVWVSGPVTGVAVLHLMGRVNAVRVVREEAQVWKIRPGVPIVAMALDSPANRGWAREQARAFADLELEHGVQAEYGFPHQVPPEQPNPPPDDWSQAQASVPAELRARWAALPPAERQAKERAWYMYWAQVLRHRPGAAQGGLFTEHDVPQHLRNPDDELRRLERAAAGGDRLAKKRLAVARRRAGIRYFGRKQLPQDVTIERAPAFRHFGIYRLTVAGRTWNVYRDPQDRRWYLEPGRVTSPFLSDWIGDSLEEAIATLRQREFRRSQMNPGSDERARRAARAGDPIAVLRERLRQGLVTPEQVAWAEALTWKPSPGARTTYRIRPGNFVRRGLLPFEDALTELVGRDVIRWHMQDAQYAYDYMDSTPALRIAGPHRSPKDAFAVFEADGSAYGDWQVQRVDEPDDAESRRFQREAGTLYAQAIGVPFIQPGWAGGEPFNDPTAWWYVATHLLPRKDRAAIATIAFLAIHNPIHAWEVFRGWQAQYVGGTGAELVVYPHPALQFEALHHDLRGLALHLLGGPLP